MARQGFLVLLGLVALFSAKDVCAESVSTTIHHHYQSPRALGMGDAFVALADDYSGLLYNPAALARREDGQMNGGIGFGVTTGITSMFQEFADIANSNKTDAQKQVSYLETIQKHYGDVFSTRLRLFEGAWVRPGWGVAFIPMDFSLEMAMHQLVGPSINTTVYADTTFAMGFGKNVPSANFGRLSWGVTGKFVNRGYFSKSITAVDLASSSQIVNREDLVEGYTIDADLGILWTPEIPEDGAWKMLKVAHPTFGAVVRNVAETGFGNSLKLVNKTAQNGTPEKLFRVVDLGSRWELPSKGIFGGRAVFDVKDLNHPDFSWNKALHAGVELDWAMTNWWKGAYRFGLSQGFWTAGLSAKLLLFNLDLVSYANDVGSQSTPVESRMYALRMNLDF